MFQMILTRSVHSPRTASLGRRCMVSSDSMVARYGGLLACYRGDGILSGLRCGLSQSRLLTVETVCDVCTTVLPPSLSYPARVMTGSSRDSRANARSVRGAEKNFPSHYFYALTCELRHALCDPKQRRVASHTSKHYQSIWLTGSAHKAASFA
jgi:hypothetical protein